jgi:hypothetical protein
MLANTVLAESLVHRLSKARPTTVCQPSLKEATSVTASIQAILQVTKKNKKALQGLKKVRILNSNKKGVVLKNRPF